MNIIETAIRRPVTVSMFTLAALVFGLVLVGRLGFNLLPELSYPTLTVRTDFEGSAPAEVENLITRPLEGNLGTVKGLRQIRSVSKAGRSDIYLEFYWGTNIDLASLDVREKMDQVQLPLEVKPPTLLRFNPNNEPIIRLSLSQKLNPEDNPVQSLAKLRRFADLRLSRRLETVEGVAAAKASGGYEDQIQILLDQNYLSQLNLTVEDISQRLKSENINLSGGQIKNGHQQLLVRTFNEYQSLDDFANTIVLSKDNKIVKLKDIAKVEFTHKDPTAIIRHNGEQAVEIAIYKEGDANTVQVAKKLHAKLKLLEKDLPDNMKVVVLTDASKFIEQSISELRSSAVIGGILAMLIIYLFLGELRPTLIISATIPLSVIITFNLMYAANIDMNIMSLGGLALAIGMLVDNAIVVLENIDRKRQQGLTLYRAAAEGAKEVSGAITASTLTTIAVFLPLIFVEGIAGQLFRDQALTITFSLLVSLIIALTLIPMLAAKEITKKEQPLFVRNERSEFARIALFVPEFLFVILPWSIFWILKKFAQMILLIISIVIDKFIAKIFNAGYKFLSEKYHSLLDSSLASPAATLFIAIVIFASSLTLVSKLPKVVLPEMAQGELIIKIQQVPGTAIQLTDQRVVSLSKKLLQVKGIKEVFSIAGSGNKLTANPEQEGDNRAEFTLLLEKGISREQENQLLVELRLLLEQESNAITADVERPQLFNFATPLSIELFGYDMKSLKIAADSVIQKLEKSDRFIDLHSNMKSGYPEAQITFDQYKLAKLGIPMKQATQAVVNAIRGNKATRYRLKEQQIDVLVRLNNSSRDELQDVSNLIINPTSKHPVPLSSVASVTQTLGPSEIMRIDQQRVVVVEGQLLYGGLAEAIDDAQNLLASVKLPVGVNLLFGGQGEEMSRSFNSLMIALALAIFMVYLVMASQFESLLHPFIILFSIPLALTGAIVALYITHTEISVVVFLGLIMLAGIVVNNAIVLLDKINQLRLDGVEKIRAIREAAASRLRPILMTTLTTVLGMLPLATGISEGTEIRAPMAITVIGGLLVSTLLTLVVIPVMYQVMDRKDYAAIIERNQEL
ncbi:MAG TPA: efflux RND transporter permease subunit [Aeromonadales bacterium]|nr:efflux RND transporter permease subunit [Aeromonadales bacterium]